MDKRIGTITIIITHRATQAAQVNTILGDYGETIIGRMGLPYAPKGLHIIALIVHASNDEIGALAGVEVKSALT